jgi:hypothetical protein
MKVKLVFSIAVFLLAIGLTLVLGFNMLSSGGPSIQEKVVVTDVFVDMNNDGHVDYVPYAEVIFQQLGGNPYDESDPETGGYAPAVPPN